jgi:integrase
MSVRKRGGVWWHDFMINGERYRKPIPEAKTKKDALDTEADARLAVREGRYEHSTKIQTVADYAKEVYMPWCKENKRSDETYKVNALVEYFGEKTFEQITPIMIEKYKRERKNGLTRYERPRSCASVNRELAVLSRIFTLAIRDKVTRKNPVAEVKKFHEDNKRTRYLLPEEEVLLLAHCTGDRAHLRPVVILAVHTGLRRGEILKLAKSDVDFIRNIIHVRNTKNNKDRFVPLNEVARAELLRLVREAGEHEYLFQNQKTQNYVKNIKRSFAKAREKAGLVNFRFHDLRHTFASRLAEEGVDSFTIMELLGHSDLRMTARYTHASDPRKRDAVAKLAKEGQSNVICHNFVTNEKRKTG